MAAATAARMVQVAPGRYVPTKEGDAPDFTFARWSKKANGEYELLPEATRLVRLTGELIRQLGFAGRADTLFRLGRAGFIEVVKVSPQAAMINLDSWFNHVRRCAEDPEFWETEENRDEYRKAL